MVLETKNLSQKTASEGPVGPSLSPLQESWRLLRKNRLAFAGLVIFVIFFCVALAGLVLTYGNNPIFDPALVRLEEKVRPPSRHLILSHFILKRCQGLACTSLGLTISEEMFLPGCCRGPGFP